MGDDAKADRQAARQQRRERGQQRYELLEKARRERRSKVRQTLREGARLPGLPSRRVLIGLLATAVAFTLLVALHRPSVPGTALTTSCTTPAIALAAAPTGGGTNVRYAITGPPAGTYVVAVDAFTARVQGDGAVVTPARAVAVTVRRGLHGCAADGTLPALASGPHQVVLFRDGALVARAAAPSP